MKTTKLTHPLGATKSGMGPVTPAPKSIASTAIAAMKESTKLGDLAARGAMTTLRNPK